MVDQLDLSKACFEPAKDYSNLVEDCSDPVEGCSNPVEALIDLTEAQNLAEVLSPLSLTLHVLFLVVEAIHEKASQTQLVEVGL